MASLEYPCELPVPADCVFTCCRSNIINSGGGGLHRPTTEARQLAPTKKTIFFCPSLEFVSQMYSRLSKIPQKKGIHHISTKSNINLFNFQPERLRDSGGGRKDRRVRCCKYDKIRLECQKRHERNLEPLGAMCGGFLQKRLA